jgi:hypothetical protein
MMISSLVLSGRVETSHLARIVKGLGIGRSRAFATEVSHVSRFGFTRLTEVEVNLEAAYLLLCPTSTTITSHTEQKPSSSRRTRLGRMESG